MTCKILKGLSILSQQSRHPAKKSQSFRLNHKKCPVFLIILTHQIHSHLKSFVFAVQDFYKTIILRILVVHSYVFVWSQLRSVRCSHTPRNIFYISLSLLCLPPLFIWPKSGMVSWFLKFLCLGGRYHLLPNNWKPRTLCPQVPLSPALT